ncbi:MAG: hypothetical protein LBD60_01865 [Puniceicoccales bacterium]|jgi:hypothetical protein|nr:hypothetical protein [Puniceicoccales bacterium]
MDSVGGIRSIVDVGFKEALREGGIFKTPNGTVKIEQDPGGKIKITESIIGKILSEDGTANLGNVGEFKTRKEAKAWLGKNELLSDQSITIVKEYDEAKAEAWLKKHALSPQEMAMEAMKEIDEIEGFSSLEGDKQAYIKEYARQMIEGGDNPEFAIAVGKNMVLLYNKKIDEKLPSSLIEKNTKKRTEENMKISAAVEALKPIMEDNGGDYKIIDHYYNKQMASPRNRTSQAMRYFLLTQRQDGNKMEDSYYLGFHKDEQKVTKLKLKEIFEKICQKYSDGDPEKYARTVAMHQAFTAIALNKVDFPGKHSGTCTVFRGMTYETDETDPKYIQRKTGDTVAMRHNVAESTSIGEPLDMFNMGGTDTYEFEVPFSRVLVPYFLHLFDTEGRYPIKPEKFWIQREFVCNLNGLSAKIIRNGWDD